MASILMSNPTNAAMAASKMIIDAIKAQSPDRFRIGGGGDSLSVSKVLEFLQKAGLASLHKELTDATIDPNTLLGDVDAELMTKIFNELNALSIQATCIERPTKEQPFLERPKYVAGTPNNGRDAANGIECYTRWKFNCEVVSTAAGAEKSNIVLLINLTDQTTSILWASNIALNDIVTLDFKTNPITNNNVTKTAAWVRCQ